MSSANVPAHESEGGDTALVFLHYFGGAGASWNAVIEALGPDVRCIAPDLCGFGKSHCPDAPMSVDEQAEEVLGRIEFLGLKRYTLIGHSMGGKIAMAIAARRPAGLQSLILIAPSPPTPEPMTDEARKELLEMFGDAERIRVHLQKIAAHSLSDSALADEVALHLQARRIAWRAWLEEGSREDISSRMQQVEVSALVLGGEADKAFTPEFLKREVVAYFSQAKLQIIAGAGHLLPLEQPSAVTAAIRTWHSE